MDTSGQTSDPTFLQGWYDYAAEQPWAVDTYLRILRTHELKSREQQRHEFGATPQDFLRLRGMPLPRPDSFAMDAQNIAQICHLQHSDTFVQTMLLARQLVLTSPSSSVTQDAHQYYEAAFDAVDDLDSSP